MCPVIERALEVYVNVGGRSHFRRGSGLPRYRCGPHDESRRVPLECVNQAWLFLLLGNLVLRFVARRWDSGILRPFLRVPEPLLGYFQYGFEDGDPFLFDGF